MRRTWLIRDIEIGLNLLTPENEALLLQQAAAKRLGIPEDDIGSMRVIRDSVDARKRHDMRAVFSVQVDTEQLPSRGIASADLSEVQPQSDPYDLEAMARFAPVSGERPIIVGAGPAGLFCTWLLAHRGLRPILLERGKPVEERVLDVDQFWRDGQLDPDSNVQFGEGGAGTFSDGKLTTRIHDPRCARILDLLAEWGAPPEIRTRTKPHVGTDRLRTVIRTMRGELLRLGAEIRFNSRVTGISTTGVPHAGARVCGVELADGTSIASNVVVLAIGHSARDTFASLRSHGVAFEPKPFSVGLRIEHPQEWVNHSRYGDVRHYKLGAGEYQLFERFSDRTAYTFCMCPGGVVVNAASEAGGIVTNGMSYLARDGVNANSAFVVSVSPGDFDSSDPLAGIAFQRRLEQAARAAAGAEGVAPVQLLGDFAAGRASTRFGEIQPSMTGNTGFARLDELLPGMAVKAMRDALPLFDRRMKGFMREDAVLTGVETRTSSPVRITRNERLVSVSCDGLYPAGEGAGYAGGIMSAAADGLRVAEAICGMAAAAGGDLS